MVVCGSGRCARYVHSAPWPARGVDACRGARPRDGSRIGAQLSLRPCWCRHGARIQPRGSNRHAVGGLYPQFRLSSRGLHERHRFGYTHGGASRLGRIRAEPIGHHARIWATAPVFKNLYRYAIKRGPSKTPRCRKILRHMYQMCGCLPGQSTATRTTEIRRRPICHPRRQKMDI